MHWVNSYWFFNRAASTPTFQHVLVSCEAPIRFDAAASNRCAKTLGPLPGRAAQRLLFFGLELSLFLGRNRHDNSL